MDFWSFCGFGIGIPEEECDCRGSQSFSSSTYFQVYQIMNELENIVCSKMTYCHLGDDEYHPEVNEYHHEALEGFNTN